MDGRKIVVVAVLGVLGLGLFSTFSAQPSATATLGAGGSTSFAEISAVTESNADNYYHENVVTWDAIEGTATPINPGDVYDIDLSNSDYAGDLLVTLYITNPDEVSQKYSYWNALVNAWKTETSDIENTTSASWSTATGENAWISLSQGYITLVVSNDGTNNHVEIAVDDGSCYTIDAGSGSDPELYITVRQA